MSIKHRTVQDVLSQQNCTLLKTSYSCIIKNWLYVNSGMACATSVNVLILNGLLLCYLIELLKFNLVNQYVFLTTIPCVLPTLLYIMHIYVL